MEWIECAKEMPASALYAIVWGPEFNGSDVAEWYPEEPDLAAGWWVYESRDDRLSAMGNPNYGRIDANLITHWQPLPEPPK